MMEGFNFALFGKVAKTKASLDTHISLSTLGVHGSTVVATANKLVHRDASGRAQIATPSLSADIANKGYVDSAIAGLSFVTNVASGVGLTGGSITSTGTLSLSNTGVVPSTYTVASVTVDAQGRITAASTGNAGVLSIVSSTTALSVSGSSAIDLAISNATQSVAGLFSPTDKAKLDGIESSADVNDVLSVFGRTGSVVAKANDYDITQIDGVTVSTSSPSGGSNGHIWFRV